jgi:Protein of unknown function (DUF2630)
VARGGVEPPTFRFSVGRSYQLSYLAGCTPRGEARPNSTGARAEPRNPVRGRQADQDYRVSMAQDGEIRHHISELVETERSLRAQLSSGEITAGEEHERMRKVEAELDQCWDLLRQREALRSAGQDPSAAATRSEEVVEKYLG